MASLRLDTGLNGEPPAASKRVENNSSTSYRTVDWVSTATASTGLNLTLIPSAAPYEYHDLSAFRDLTVLHEGRHSTVWSAACKRTGRTVVIKGYNMNSLQARQLNNVRREIGLLRFFRDAGCKGVVALLAAFEENSVMYLIFEACMRGDLYQHLMRNRGTLHEEFVVTKIVFPLLCVLQQLHTLHVVHRDIKPENIFVTEDGDIALGDFGLAGHKFHDRMTERVGTLDYMAPEILSIPPHDDQDSDGVGHHTDGARTYDEKVDIWATGVLVYELLVGRPPFEVDDPQETTKLILHSEASNYPVHISQYARDFVAQALIKNPSARPSADELLQHAWLRHYFGGKIPDPAAATGGGVTAGLLKSWLVASWSDLSKASADSLKPNSAAPNRLILAQACSPRKALSTGDDPNQSIHLEDDLTPSSQYKRKSVPGGSEAGSDSPQDRDRDMSKQFGSSTSRHAPSGCSSMERQMEVGEGDVGVSDRDRDSAQHRLTPSQYPSRESSAGSMDQAVPAERNYLRNDSGASASSSISIASFASLQHMPHSNSGGEPAESDDMGMVQRSASISGATMSRSGGGGFPTGNSQLKPVWQSSTPAVVGSRKTPGKSRFAA